MIKIVILFLCVMNNACLDFNTAPQDLEPKNVSKNLEKRLQKLSTLSVPSSLKQSYKDDRGNDVVYDHKEQLKKLILLESKGKNLNLIFAHPSEKKLMRTPLQGPNDVWVIAQKDKNAFVQDTIPNLLLDYDDNAHFKTMPDEFFSTIMFDPCVINHMRSLKSATKELYRMLKARGKYLADLETGSYGLVSPGEKLEARCKQFDAEIYTTSAGMRFCLAHWDGSILVELFVDGRERNFAKGDKQEIANKRKELIKNRLEKIFGKGACIPKKSQDVPFKYEYLECTK